MKYTFFQKSSACPCFITSAIDMFYPRTVIGDNKTQVLIFFGFLYHCIMHQGGRVNPGFDLREKIIDSVLLALNATCQDYAQSESVLDQY